MANSGVSTSVTELPESRVRVQAEVAPDEIEKRVEQSARTLGRELRVPGFRKGKVPPPVVIQRVGREAVLDEAVRDNLTTWYSAAIDDARIAPVGDPQLDVGGLPGTGEPLTFSIEIGVRPKAQLGAYKNLQVPREELEVSDEAIAAEVEILRDRGGRLETVARPAGNGDFVVMDFVGSVDGVPFQGGEGRDQMVELGSGRLVGSFEEQLEGASGGDELAVAITFPQDYGAEELAGADATFAVTVKEVKAKQLPDLDEEFAVEQGFDTLDELREDVRERFAAAEAARIESRFREAALDAAVEAATVELPEALVEARAKELWGRMIDSLSTQGIHRAKYLEIAGKTEEEIIEETKPDAGRQLRREAVLAAVVEAEAIDPSEEELLQALAPDAERTETAAEKLLEAIRSSGRVDALIEDVAHGAAIDRIVDLATPVSPVG